MNILSGRTRLIALSPILLLVIASAPATRTNAQVGQSDEVKSIRTRISALRSTPDGKRGEATLAIALDIRRIASPEIKLRLADSLANLATEGDFGKQTIQEVANTLADALKLEGAPGTATNPAGPYVTLAQLVRYEHASVSLDDPQFTAALHKLEVDDETRDEADFSLNDLSGKQWTLKALKGDIVLVNFWATWCPPCRKEIPDLELLYQRFKDKGFIVLGISDEAAAKVAPYVAAHSMTYPVLLDAGRKVNTLMGVQGIPRTLIYDRTGKLVAEAIDMRTQQQLLALLAKAGLQ